LKLGSLPERIAMTAGTLFREPWHGQLVPLLAVTYSDAEHKYVPVGGSHISPFTGTRVPIELGDLMLDVEDRPCSILSVGFNAKHVVVPLGGFPVDRPEECYVAGEFAVEPLSGLPATVGGLRMLDESQGPSVTTGAAQVLLHTMALKEENIYVEALEELNSFIVEKMSADLDNHIKMYPEELENKLLNVLQHRDEVANAQKKLLASVHTKWLAASRTRGQWDELTQTGGVIGKISFGARRQLPILVGVKLMHQMSEQEVPVLGVTTVGKHEEMFPLGGVMLCAKTSDIVPITISAEFREVRAQNDEISYVNSAVVDPVTDKVMPSAQIGFSYKPDPADYYMSHGVVANYATLSRDFHGRVDKTVSKLLAKFAGIQATPEEKVAKVSTEVRKIFGQLNADRDAFCARKAELALGAGTFPEYVRSAINDDDEWKAQAENLRVAIKKVTKGMSLGVYKATQNAKAAQDAVAAVYEASAELMAVVTSTDVAVNASDKFLEHEVVKRNASSHQSAKPRGMHELLDRLVTTLQGISSTSAVLAKDEAGQPSSPTRGSGKLNQSGVQSSSSLGSGATTAGDGGGAAGQDDGAAAAAPSQVDKEELERKALERAKIEGTLLQAETTKIRAVKEAVETERKEQMKAETTKMIEKTMKAETPEEKAAVFAEYQEAVATLQIESEEKLQEILEMTTSALAEVRTEALANHEMEGDEDLSQIKDRMLQESLESPDAVIKSSSANDRRLQIQETRAKMEATSKRNAKLRNRLAKKLKALEKEAVKEEKQAAKDGMPTSEAEAKLDAAIAPAAKQELVADVMQELTTHIETGAIRLADDANIVEAMNDTNKAVAEKTAVVENVATDLKAQIMAQLSESAIGETSDQTAHNAEMDSMIEEQLALISTFVEGFNEKVVQEETKKTFDKVVHEQDGDKKDAVIKHAVNKKARKVEAAKQMVEIEEQVRQQLEDEEKAKEQVKHVVNETRSIETSQSDTKVVAAVDRIQAEVEKKVAAKMAELEKGHVQSQVDLRLKQEQKLKDLEADLAAELELTEKEALAELEREYARKVALEVAAQQDVDGFDAQKLAEQAQNSTAEELVRENARRTHEMETQQRLEKQKNAKAIKDRLAAAKERKLAKLKLDQEVERAAVSADQQAAKSNIVSEETLKVEAQVLKDAKKEGGQDDKMIFAVLQHRHKEEQALLELQNGKDIELAVSKAISDAKDAIEKDKARVHKTHKAELALEEAEGKTNHARLKKKQEAELAELEEKAETSKTTAERQAKMACQLAHSNAKLALRQKQYEEIAATFKKLSPDAEMVAQYQEAADAAKKNAAEFKEKVLQQQKDHVAAVKAKSLGNTAEKRAAVQAEIERVEAELEAERMKDKAAQEKKKAEREAREIFLSVQSATSGNQSQEQRDKLLEEHSRTQDAISRANREQQNAQEDALQAKLAARRAAKVRKRLADLKKEDANLSAADALALKDEERALEEQQRQLDEFEQKQREGGKRLRPKTPGARGRRGRPGTAASRGTRHGASSSSLGDASLSGDEDGAVSIGDLEHILQKVADLERIVGDKKEVFVDGLDVKWQGNVGNAAEIPAKQLQDDEFVILQFAQFIFQLVGRDEAIHASETLPASNRQALSAYANSYAWNAGTAAVFFRRARLTNIGDCLSVAIHAAAYVGAGGGAIGDTDPAFIAELHRCVALVYSDLFAASLK